jgi:CRP-like cAMP-binding protein/formate hydrogenlyase subunit 6/NADH:ubiquinone oxidoreductase subunit I
MNDAFFEMAELRSEEEGLFARDVNGRMVRMDKATAADYDKQVTVRIDGQTVTVPKAVPTTDSQGNPLKDESGLTIPRATTIYDAAAQLFVKKPGDVNPIPVLCHQEHMKPVAVCRICVVEIAKMKRGKIERERKLLPACQHRVEDTMEIQTIESPDPAARDRVRSAVRLLTELLMSDHLRPGEPKDATPYNELWALARRLQIPATRFSRNPADRGRDASSLVIAVDHNSCILCDRCVRACDEVKKNFIIGRTGKGYTAHIGFDLDTPMGKSGCVSCGECMISCPTGALTFRRPVESVRSQDLDTSFHMVSAAELKQHPLFAGVSYKFLEWNAGSVVHRRLKPGEMLCREGDFGSTAFILEKGRFQVSIQTAFKHVQNKKTKGLLGFLGRIQSSLSNVGDQLDEVSRTTIIPSDGGTPLAYGKPIAVRTPEDVILGEMTCMSNYPRSATVVAIEDAEVLEIPRNVLYILQRNKVARDILDRVYRERALTSHLQSVGLFAGLGSAQQKQCVEFLRERVELIRADPGQVIFRQGEVADHFYMVRLGFVKVSQECLGEERVLDYLGPGRHFGEIGLLSNISNLIAGSVPQGMAKGVRTATCSALDDVELVRIRGEHFRELLDHHETLRERLVQDAIRLLENNEAARKTLNRPLGDFLNQGLYNAQRLLVLDLEKCTRCDECTKACADSHQGVTRLIREGLRFDKFLVASSCRSCLDPYCLVGCPVDSIHRSKSLEIIIEDWCIGCGQCARNCPYGNINMHGLEELRDDPEHPGRKKAVVQQKATTCDLCRDVVGPGEDPSCVYACPHDAAFRMSGPELLRIVDAKAGS